MGSIGELTKHIWDWITLTNKSGKHVHHGWCQWCVILNGPRRNLYRNWRANMFRMGWNHQVDLMLGVHPFATNVILFWCENYGAKVLIGRHVVVGCVPRRDIFWVVAIMGVLSTLEPHQLTKALAYHQWPLPSTQKSARKPTLSQIFFPQELLQKQAAEVWTWALLSPRNWPKQCGFDTGWGPPDTSWFINH